MLNYLPMLCINLYMFFAASEKVESVSLELSNDKRSGGNEIFIEILQNNTSCQVKKVARINRGETKKWTTESDLETCYGASFDIDGPEIKFRIRTTHGNALWSNDFKPKIVTIIIGKTVFKSEEMNDWVDITKGSMVRNAVMLKGMKGCLMLIKILAVCYFNVRDHP